MESRQGTEGAGEVRLNVQKELQRYKIWRANAPSLVDPDLLQILGVITGYLQKLTTADGQAAMELREIGPRLLTELNRLMAQQVSGQTAGQTITRKDYVLYAIYDRIESQLIVAKANQNQMEEEIYQALLDYLNLIYAQELEWSRMESLGRTYNPDEYDGFLVERPRTNQAERASSLEIVYELRAGFTCRGVVIRKPVVEFLK
jgi:hypothetical protein